MAVSAIKTTPLSWGSLMARGNREPIDDSTLNNSYAHLLWELNQPNTYLPNTVKDNKGGSGNFYVGLITAVPYAAGDKNQYASFTENTNDMQGPWYVSYCDTDEPQGTGKFAFAGHGSKGNPNTYYADRIVLRREMDYALQRSSVSPLQLGTYYTGVGMWYDSYMQSLQYTDGNQELPDGTYFPTVSYAEIFNDYKHNTAYGSYSHVEGGQNYTGIYATYAHAEGYHTTTSSPNSHAEGYKTYANGIESHAEGYHTYTNGDASHTEGYETIANGHYSHAEGKDSIANGQVSHAEGEYTYANGDSSHAEGGFTYANGDSSHSEGYHTYANRNYSHAEGDHSTANGQTSHAEGGFTYANGDSSHAEGNRTTASGQYSHAEGNNTIASGIGSHAEGGVGNVSNSRINVLRRTAGPTISNTTASGNYSHAEGYGTTASGNNSHAEGYHTTASGRQSHAEGYDSIASGNNSHAEGGSTASGALSHAEGSSTASGDDSHAEGRNTSAHGWMSHAEGNFTTANGKYSHAEGNTNIANGESSHAEGTITQAFGDNSHAEGYNTIANGWYSHTEGANTRALGDGSHAEGKSTAAHGNSSHAQNQYTFANGVASTAIGHQSYANGTNSFTSGTYTIANNDSEVSIGKYNKTYDDAIFNIGIGTSDANRKNAVDVRTTGVAYFHQSAYVYDPTVVNLKKQYPGTYDNFDDESQVISMSYWQISYNATYDLIKAKTDGIPDSVKSIDNFDTSFQDKNVLHYTTQHFNGDRTWVSNPNNTVVLPIANNDNGDNPRRTDFATGAKATAGLMSAMDKARLDDIWTGDKPIVPISIKTGTWTIYKNDGTTTYTLADIKNQSNSVSSCAGEYGFKVKWSGTWQYSKPCGANDNYKAADSTSGTFGTTLPSSTAAGSTGDTFTSEILGPNGGTVASQNIVAAKKGLVIAEFPSSVSVGNPSHSGRIVPATGNDETSTSVTWGTYRLYFYGQVDTLNPTMDIMKSLTVGSGQPNSKGWTIQYTADTTHCFAIAYPSIWGKISTIKKNGVEIITTSFLFVGEFDYTNGAGYTQKYYIYRSGMGTANMAITVN